MRLRDYLGKEVHVTMDRPLGSKHPKNPDMVYPINYGYIEGTLSGDGDEVDAYIIGEHQALETYVGHVIGVIERKDDVEDKLVVADHTGYSNKEILDAVDFTERYFDSTLYRQTEHVTWSNDRLEMMTFKAQDLALDLGVELGYYNKHQIKLGDSYHTQSFGIPVMTYKSCDIGFNLDGVFIEIFEDIDFIRTLTNQFVGYRYEVYDADTLQDLNLDDKIEGQVGFSLYIPYHKYNKDLVIKILKEHVCV